MKVLLTLFALLTFFAFVLSIYCGINLAKRRHMSKAEEITVGMSAVKALSILGSFFDEKVSEKGEDTYHWKINNEHYNGIKDVTLKVKNHIVTSIEYK